LGLFNSEIHRNSSYLNDLGLDSGDLDDIELVMEYESTFGINIPDEEVEKLTTVGITVDYITEKLKQKNSRVLDNFSGNRTNYLKPGSI
jgi:acyl carrier protein